MHGTRRFGSVTAVLCATAFACSSCESTESSQSHGTEGPGTPLEGERRRLAPADARRPRVEADGGVPGVDCLMDVAPSPRGPAPPDWEREPRRREAASEDGKVVLEGADEFPDVLQRGGALPATAALSVGLEPGPASNAQRAKVTFEIARRGSCTPLRLLESTVPMDAGTRVSVDWDGTDAGGQPLPDGEYLYRARAEPLDAAGDPAVTPFHVIRLTGVASAADCEAAAHRARAEAAPGVSPDALDRKLHEDLAFCANPGSGYCEAALAAQVNADRRAAVLRYLSGTFSTRQELAVNHDRTRKHEAARGDPALLAAICAGDGDGDLVPDSTDACPETPPLTPTTADGCTDPALPAGPDRRHVDAILAAMGIVHDERCNGAAAPTTPHGAPVGANPVALLYCAADENGRRGLVLTAVGNQPEGCPYWYQIKAQVVRTDGTVLDAFVAPRGDTLTPITGRSGRPYAMLEFAPGSPGALGEWARSDVARANVSVRAMNGSGLSSPWSAPLPVYVMTSDCTRAVEGDL